MKEENKKRVIPAQAWMASYTGSSDTSKFCFIIPGVMKPESFLKRIKRDANLLFVRFATPVESLFAKDFVSEHKDDEFIEDQARAWFASQSLE